LDPWAIKSKTTLFFRKIILDGQTSIKPIFILLEQEP